jgi:hypothetical protein
MTVEDFNHRLYDRPFKPFKIHLSDGSSHSVTNSGLVIVSKSSVILPTELGKDRDGNPLVVRWRTLALAHMVQFSDIDEMVGGKRPKKRG